jgi:hypothetical protein
MKHNYWRDERRCLRNRCSQQPPLFQFDRDINSIILVPLLAQSSVVVAGVLCHQPDGADSLRPVTVEPVGKFTNPQWELNEGPVTDRKQTGSFFLSASPLSKGVGEKLKYSHNFACVQF